MGKGVGYGERLRESQSGTIGLEGWTWRLVPEQADGGRGESADDGAT